MLKALNGEELHLLQRLRHLQTQMTGGFVDLDPGLALTRHDVEPELHHQDSDKNTNDGRDQGHAETRDDFGNQLGTIFGCPLDDKVERD